MSATGIPGLFELLEQFHVYIEMFGRLTFLPDVPEWVHSLSPYVWGVVFFKMTWGNIPVVLEMTSSGLIQVAKFMDVLKTAHHRVSVSCKKQIRRLAVWLLRR